LAQSAVVFSGKNICSKIGDFLKVCGTKMTFWLEKKVILVPQIFVNDGIWQGKYHTVSLQKAYLVY
jgi:hypothetical protein